MVLASKNTIIYGPAGQLAAAFAKALARDGARVFQAVPGVPGTAWTRWPASSGQTAGRPR